MEKSSVQIIYELKPSENSENAVLYSEDGKEIECTDSYLRGDIDKDKTISAKDLMILKNYVLDSPPHIGT